MRTSRRSPHRGWVGPLIQVGQIAWAAPQVVVLRASRMLGGGWPPSARDRREYVLMGREKVEGLVEVATVLAQARRSTSPKSGSALVEEALAPVHRRVLANRRRLARG